MKSLTNSSKVHFTFDQLELNMDVTRGCHLMVTTNQHNLVVRNLFMSNAENVNTYQEMGSIQVSNQPYISQHGLFVIKQKRDTN